MWQAAPLMMGELATYSPSSSHCQLMCGLGDLDVQGKGRGIARTDHDGPDVDEDEEADVGELLEGKEEWEDVVGDALREAVYWVESVAGEGGRHDPLMMWLVEGPVDPGVMEAAVDPVDEEVGKDEKEGKLEEVVE